MVGEKEMAALLEAMDKEPADKDGRPNTKLMQKYRDHYGTRTAFMTDERTGYVWLYLQK